MYKVWYFMENTNILLGSFIIYCWQTKLSAFVWQFYRFWVIFCFLVMKCCKIVDFLAKLQKVESQLKQMTSSCSCSWLPWSNPPAPPFCTWRPFPPPPGWARQSLWSDTWWLRGRWSSRRTRRYFSVSNSNLYCNVESWRMESEEWRVWD